ncbi:sugar phosphate isomerase/epimerase family protein [Georgenia faecalis]|uniref:Sugar phosphate isomerase/epimerase family protein n=1 Tax=Georgenia faecalis TaxID=2483799 RepID=A0ABV9DA97_9MICO|nr:TIM barrel protein [Georgenia faecalis]
MASEVWVADAPVNYGVFELGGEKGGRTPDGEQCAAWVAEAGYDGIDLGPSGFLGRGAELQERLRRHGIGLAGGWVDYPFEDDDAFRAASATLDDIIANFLEAAEVMPDRPPRPTLASAGSPLRQAHPGGQAPGLGLDDAQWDVFAANLQRVVERFRAAGLEPTFHHHVCTYVETPEEVEQLLARTDVGLCLDTGHLILGGGDPLTALEAWGDRINHVHLKDADKAELDAIVQGQGDMRAVWAGKAFVPMGTGDFDAEAFMPALLASGYRGWAVVEQDYIPAPDDPADTAFRAQRANREALRRWLP